MLKIAHRLSEIENDLKDLKQGKTPAVPKLPIAPNAAQKFFGDSASVNIPFEPECVVDIKCKANDISKDTLIEISKAQTMFRKAIMEFCEEFEIKELNLTYIDPTPIKNKNI